jgi:hypothetical protein
MADSHDLGSMGRNNLVNHITPDLANIMDTIDTMQLGDVSVTDELGTTGLTRYSGYVFEEFLATLQGTKGMAVYREMRDNDSTIGAMLFAFEQLIRKASWRIDNASDAKDDCYYGNFVTENLHDMSQSWSDHLSEISSMLTFGWSWHEIVYKFRNGSLNEDGRPTSNYSDGLIGWRRLPIRAQETLWRWDFKENGTIKAIVQRAAPDFKTRVIPIEKSLLFRPKVNKNNPEGRSVLRNAYLSWYFKKKLCVIEAIGAERDLAGLPIAKVPAELLSSNPTAQQAQILAVIKNIVSNVRNDEQAGVIWPRVLDENGKELYTFELLSTGGRRQFDTSKIIDRYDQGIAQSILADMILIGHSSRGSYALMEAKVDFFSQAMNGWLDSIGEIFNRFAIPRLFKINGFPTTRLPTLQHLPVDNPDLKDLSGYMKVMVDGGFIKPTLNDEGYLRQLAGLPAADDIRADTEIGKALQGVIAKEFQRYHETISKNVGKDNANNEMANAVKDLRTAIHDIMNEHN